jgi:hypothetical protein
MGNISLKASPTTLRLDRARSEHGWNVAASQPSVGSKFSTETVRGAAPIPERPSDTFVIVVSVMNPFSGFQNDYMLRCFSLLRQRRERQQLSWQ